MTSSLDLDNDSHRQLLSDEESTIWTPREKIRSRKWPAWSKVMLYLLAITSIFVFGSLVGYYIQDIDSRCTRHVSQFSPLMHDVDVTYHVEQFNGSFLNENIYRQGASPEVDEAWEALGVDYRPLKVPPEDAEQSGISSGHAKINEKYGGGYPANLEGLHHLHCLNLLRKSLYYNYDYYHAMGKGAFVNEDHIIRKHVSHCLDILRQQLMCTVDVGVLGQVWVFPDNPTPFVDFNTRHRCRNFDQIREWAYEHQLPEDPPKDYMQEYPAQGDKVYPEIP